MIFLNDNSPHVKSGFQHEMEAAARGDTGDRGWRPLRLGEVANSAIVKIHDGVQLRAEELADEIAEDLQMEDKHA